MKVKEIKAWLSQFQDEEEKINSSFDYLMTIHKEKITEA